MVSAPTKLVTSALTLFISCILIELNIRDTNKCTFDIFKYDLILLLHILASSNSFMNITFLSYYLLYELHLWYIVFTKF
jgi:hypothetical protein